MIHTDARFAEAVEAEVARIEQQTDAEVVVVAAAESGSYADLASDGAFAAALLVFVAMLWSPWPVSPVFGVVELGLVWWIARWALRAPWFLARVASAARKEAQVRQAAEAEFHREAVHGTPGRTGLLLYVSAMEGRVELIPDVGLQARIPRGRWAEAAHDFAHDDLDHFLAGLRKVGALLAEAVPRTEEGDRVDLPNAPRIR